MFNALKSYQSNSIVVTSFIIKNDLENHPEYPSLLALSDCLTSWGILYEAYRIERQSFNAEKLSYSFIAHLPEGGGRFILIHEIKANLEKCTDEKDEHQTFTEEEFLKKWDRIVLYAQKAKESGENNYREVLTDEPSKHIIKDLVPIDEPYSYLRSYFIDVKLSNYFRCRATSPWFKKHNYGIQ